MSEGACVVGVDLSPDAAGDLAIQADVTDEEQVRALYTRVRDELGRIDVLFNNAGISPEDDRSILDTDYEAWRRVQDVNLALGLLLLQVRDPAPDRRRRRLGDEHRLVRGGDGRSRVADLLHRVEGRRARDVTGAGGRVRAPGCTRQRALPGPADHATTAGAVREVSGPRRSAATSTCRRAASAEPREIANGALFLASDESTYVNATTFMVDGGLSAAYLTPE